MRRSSKSLAGDSARTEVPNGVAIALHGVGLTYPNASSPALEDVNLEVSAGEIVTVLGHNGAGKSSLMSIIAGITSPTTGDARVLGEPTNRTRRRTPSIGLAAQEDAVYPTLTGLANLTYVGELCGLRGQDLERRIATVSESLRLAEFVDRPASELSGGERRRLHTAMALVHDPVVALLDEPTAGVDLDTRDHILSTVRRLADHGNTVLYSTHNLSEVERLNARIVILKAGRIVADGTLAKLLDRFGTSGIELVFNRPIVTSKGASLVDALGASTVIADSNRAVITVCEPAMNLADTVRRLGPAGAYLVDAHIQTANLDQVVRRLTGSSSEIVADGNIGDRSTQ